MTLERVFRQHEVELWGIAALDDVVPEAGGRRRNAFALPYGGRAAEALPDDDQIDASRDALARLPAWVDRRETLL